MLAVDATNPSALLNLGILLAAQGRVGEAEDCLMDVLAQDPQHSPALTNLAALHAGAGNDEAATELHQRAVAAAPDDADILGNYGVFLAERGRYAEAGSLHARAIELMPHSAVARCNLAVMLTWQERYAEAEALLHAALQHEPGRADAYTNLGIVYDETARYAEAIQCHRRALALQPTSTEVLSNLGNALTHAEQYDTAYACYAHALQLDPSSGRAWGNMAAMLAQKGDAAAAEAAFREALKLDPHHARVRLNLSYLLLAQGRYAEGWVQHEARSDPRMRDRPTLLPMLPFPQWQGEPLGGRSVLIWAEQGFGDEIQFCRFVPQLKRMGARTVSVVTKTPLKRLLQTLPGVDEVLTQGDSLHRLESHDYWVLPMSLPLWAQIPEAAFARDVPYLHAPADALARWSAYLGLAQVIKPKIGLAWKGNAGNRNDLDRSLPGLATLQPLFSVLGDQVQWVSVQKGNAEDEARAAAASGLLIEAGAQAQDFADTAAIVAQLDLLICVDTAVAHLAGAMGVPCWVLLPQHKTDWRWLEQRADSPWYPAMRLFRQARRGLWAPVVAAVAGALVQWVALRD